MDNFQKSNRYDYYDIVRKLMLLTGMWPYQKLVQKLLRTGFIFTWIVTIIFVQIARYFVCESLDCILETIPLNLLAYIAIVKLLTYHFNRQKIKDLIKHLNADWNILCCEKEFDIMKKYAETGRLYTLIYAMYVYIGCLIFVCLGLFPRILDLVSPLNESRSLTLPCPAYYFVDDAEYFYYMFFHIFLGALLGITGVLAHDCNFFTCVEHVCGLFAIVGFRFEHLTYERNVTKKYLKNMDPSDNIYFENIAFSVKAHERALKFTALLENAFSSSFALQIFIVVIGMSTSLIQIAAKLHGDTAEIIRYLLFIIGQLMHLLILSFLGQQLINHSIETYDKIYNGLWYKIPVKSQRLLLFVLRKSIKINFLTAGKIYIFCLESFTSVLQCSVSYFTVLSSFDEP